MTPFRPRQAGEPSMPTSEMTRSSPIMVAETTSMQATVMTPSTLLRAFDGQVDVYDGGPGTDTVVDSSRCFYPNWPTDPIDTYVSIENRHPNVC
jgi:hypothetical protein